MFDTLDAAVHSSDEIEAPLERRVQGLRVLGQMVALRVETVLVGHVAKCDELALGGRPADLAADFVGILIRQVFHGPGFLAEDAVVGGVP